MEVCNISRIIRDLQGYRWNLKFNLIQALHLVHDIIRCKITWKLRHMIIWHGHMIKSRHLSLINNLHYFCHFLCLKSTFQTENKRQEGYLLHTLCLLNLSQTARNPGPEWFGPNRGHLNLYYTVEATVSTLHSITYLR